MCAHAPIGENVPMSDKKPRRRPATLTGLITFLMVMLICAGILTSKKADPALYPCLLYTSRCV